jgi:hypothetical protein
MYVKVFPSMYDGTLTTHGPWQALVTFQQMLVLADPQGIVDMTPEAIAARTTIPLDIIRIGVAALEQPDPESRSAELDGRRIVRVADHRSWGWQIVNYLQYRAIRDEEHRREYMREYRRKRRADGKDVNKVNKSEHVHNVHSVHRSSPKQKQKQNKTLVRSNGTIAPAQPDGFAAFWLPYPRKKAKQEALKAWCKLAPDRALQDKIAGALRVQAASEEWRRDGGRYVPHPASWLNGRRWDDELSQGAATTASGELRVAI